MPRLSSSHEAARDRARRLALALAAAGVAPPAAARAQPGLTSPGGREGVHAHALPAEGPRGHGDRQAVNFGMDNHDLIIQRNAKGAKPIAFKRIGPTRTRRTTLKLTPGRYSLWCSVAGHRNAGDAGDPRRAIAPQGVSGGGRWKSMARPPLPGTFGAPEAERLLWRAGFGPRRGEPATAREARPRRRRPLADPTRAASGSSARAPHDDEGPRRSRRPTPRATTTSGGSTGWCARAARSSSG